MAQMARGDPNNDKLSRWVTLKPAADLISYGHGVSALFAYGKPLCESVFILNLCLHFDLFKMPRLDIVAQQDHLYPYSGISFGDKRHKKGAIHL